MNTNRPINLDLSTIRFPLSAIVSILHRISGLILIAGVLILLWMLDVSLESEQGFNSIKQLLQSPLAKLILWGILSALAYHLVAGIRHLIMDMGWGESLEGGRRGASITVAVSVLLIALMGVWVW